MKRYFAAVGDVHGHIDLMIKTLRQYEEALKCQLSFILQVGDFEAHRSVADLATMAAPAKYRQLGDFPHYFNKKKRFPWPIYFIGGNHESYGLLDLYPQGSALCDNCHYLGRVATIQIDNLLVGGLSGIYQEDYFTKSRPDISEIAHHSNKLYTYFNEADIDQLLAISQVDILLLHEWPTGVINSSEGFSNSEVRHSLIWEEVGNTYSRLVVEALRPQLVLCGHMHKEYRCTMRFANGVLSKICCLANMQRGKEAIAFFEIDEASKICEIELC